jgi:hypothetical protein
MRWARWWVRRSLLSGLAVLVLSVAALPQTQQPRPRPQAQTPAPVSRPAPRLEAVAETRLLMEGLANSNFRGLERLLKEKPAATDAWTFARGQALLIAETGNLLLLRPPRNKGRDVWQERAMELRTSATNLARLVATRDHERSRAALTSLANVCNRCHQTFQVPVRLVPFSESGPETQP